MKKGEKFDVEYAVTTLHERIVKLGELCNGEINKLNKHVEMLRRIVLVLVEKLDIDDDELDERLKNLEEKI